MNHHQILLALTANEKSDGQNFDETLQQVMLKVIPLLPAEDEITEMKECSVRFQYLKTILYVLKSLRETDLSMSKTFLNMEQQKTVKSLMEIAVGYGILPYLFPGVGTGLYNTCPRAKELNNEMLTEVEKYDRLSSTVRDLTECFTEMSLRCALLDQVGPLLAALLQLSYAPLMKPSIVDTNDISEKPLPAEVQMKKEIYERLSKDQNDFKETLFSFIKNCSLGTVIKELLMMHGIREAPNWMRRRTRIHLIDAIAQPDGIVSLVNVVCSDTIDLGADWNKLDTVARLIAAPHGYNPDQYYDYVCSQLVKLLMSRNTDNSSIIAINCITALYEQNPKVCLEKIIRPITAPLRAGQNTAFKFLTKTETEVTDCIENLTKCFIPTDAKFKHPPCTLLVEIAIPLFCLYAKSYRSVCLIKMKIRDLLIHMMIDTTPNDKLFSVFLGNNDDSEYYGEKISCTFGPAGGLTITAETNDLDFEDVANTLLDLVSNNENIAFNLFNYLLRFFSDLKRIGNSSILENTEDVLERIERKLVVTKLLSSLAGIRKIQESLIKNPQPIVSFIKLLFNENIHKRTVNTELNSYELDVENIEVLYISLMLIKVILTETEKPKDWAPFNELAAFMMKMRERLEIPEQLLDLVSELIYVINHQGRSMARRYNDLNFDAHKNESHVDRALKDLADSLLPVRAHGLISLTKLLESKDRETIAKKDIILCLFQENLKDNDSFIYLSAVNGLCALACLFPDTIIEMLVQEYIDMPVRQTNGEISPEIRAKLGEILVKTTRSLGEICPAHKTILINGFLCASRDPDCMVRASSLSCLGELCKVMGFRLGHAINEVIYCIRCIIDTDKAPECRRAAVLVTSLLMRGLGKDVLMNLGTELVPLYQSLKFLYNNDDDQVLRLHAQLALEELDEVVKKEMFAVPKLEKRIFLLP